MIIQHDGIVKEVKSIRPTFGALLYAGLPPKLEERILISEFLSSQKLKKVSRYLLAMKFRFSL